MQPIQSASEWVYMLNITEMCQRCYYKFIQRSKREMELMSGQSKNTNREIKTIVIQEFRSTTMEMEIHRWA